jgi:hypothetical protein
LVGAVDILLAQKYPNEQLLHVKRTMIIGGLIQHVTSATVTEGGCRVKKSVIVV